MEVYDVTVVGGGISGSLAARFAAKHGFKTLLVERYKTPRNKTCSGLQFAYFEKLIGEKIPPEKLCKNEIYKLEMITPTNKVLKGRVKMFNFWRSTFDSWLNALAMEAGVEFRDETQLLDFHEDEGRITVKISAENAPKEVKTRYLIGADGFLSGMRKKLRPLDYTETPLGAVVNYHFVGRANLDANTLYMFYKREFCPLGPATVYLKDDTWVIGTAAAKNPLEYAERFLNYLTERHALSGRIVKKEGFAPTLKGGVYLGEGNLLMVGDAAGLLDFGRTVGMDNAALSGRLSVKAITEAETAGCPASEPYQRMMGRTVRRLETNAKKQGLSAMPASDEMLEKRLSPSNMMKSGLIMIMANLANAILPPERLIFVP